MKTRRELMNIGLRAGVVFAAGLVGVDGRPSRVFVANIDGERVRLRRVGDFSLALGSAAHAQWACNPYNGLCQNQLTGQVATAAQLQAAAQYQAVAQHQAAVYQSMMLQQLARQQQYAQWLSSQRLSSLDGAVSRYGEPQGSFEVMNHIESLYGAAKSRKLVYGQNSDGDEVEVDGIATDLFREAKRVSREKDWGARKTQRAVGPQRDAEDMDFELGGEEQRGYGYETKAGKAIISKDVFEDERDGQRKRYVVFDSDSGTQTVLRRVR